MDIHSIADFDVVRIERVPEELKRPIMEEIDALQREYKERLKPYIERLVELENTYPADVYISPRI